MNPKTVRRLLNRWAARLRLLDWTISFNIVNRAALMGNNGQTAIHELNKNAIISLTDDDDDVETTIIHELLHLHLYPLTRDADGPVVEEEQAINLIAEALYRLGGEQR